MATVIDTTRRAFMASAAALLVPLPALAGALPPINHPAGAADCADLFRRLSPEGQKAMLAVAKWLVEDGRPETDPRQLDPYWRSFPVAVAVKIEGWDKF